jgi:hypothetical protein
MPNLDSRQAHPLDAAWENSFNTAERWGLCSRAVQDSHGLQAEKWGRRAGHALADLTRGSNPMEPFSLEQARARKKLSDAVPESVRHSNLCLPMIDNLAHTLATQSDAACVAACVEAISERSDSRPSEKNKLLSALTSESIERLCKEDLDAAGRVCHAGLLSFYSLGEIITPKAPALDDLRILAAAKTALWGKIDEKGRENHGAFFPEVLLRCSNPQWMEALSSAFERKSPTMLDVLNLNNLAGHALAAASPAKPPPARGKMSAPLPAPIDKAALESARVLAGFLRGRAIERLNQLARQAPAMAARLVMVQSPTQRVQTWEKLGIVRVDAAEFLMGQDPADGSKTFVGARLQGRAWPMAESSDARERLRGVDLGYLDCFALSGASIDDLASEAAALGSPSLAGLSQVLSLPEVQIHVEPKLALWMASFASNPKPAASAGPLRI